MFPDKLWTVYSITEDDFIERERCLEELKGTGLGQNSLESLARDNTFLGVKKC